jgi:diguanylate cyclase (GGDEF)-like protein
MKFMPFKNNKVKLRLSPDKPAAISKKIDNSMIMMGYLQAHVGLIASLFCACIIYVSLFSVPNHSTLNTWFGVFMLSTLLRAQLVFYYKQDPAPSDHTRKWRNLFILGALLGGMLWGATGAMLYPQSNNLQQTLIILILAGTTAGSVPLYSSVLLAAVGFVMTALLPLILTLFVTHSHNHDNLLFDSTVTAYMFYLLALCKRAHDTMKNSISLQYENHALLSNLSEAKHQLEIINKKLEQAATHDPLTNVANRNLFVTNFDAAIETAKQNKKLLALLYIDLDNFKTINDIHGHHVGDQLLLVVIERMEEFVETSDVIARLGGDEFTILIEDVTNPNDVAKLAKKICHAVSDPIKINGLELKTSVSIGIGVYPIDGDNAEKLLNVADKAMYYIKERGGNNIRFNVTLLTG